MANEPSSRASNSDTIMSWTFDERELHERTVSWYIGAIVVVIGLLIYSFFANNLLFGVVIVLAALVFIVLHRNRDVVSFTVTPEGVYINRRLYPFEDIKHFAIVYQPPAIKKIYFEFKNVVTHRLIIPLLDQDPVMVREKLLDYLTEDREREHEPVSDWFSRIFKL